MATWFLLPTFRPRLVSAHFCICFLKVAGVFSRLLIISSTGRSHLPCQSMAVMSATTPRRIRSFQHSGRKFTLLCCGSLNSSLFVASSSLRYSSDGTSLAAVPFQLAATIWIDYMLKLGGTCHTFPRHDLTTTCRVVMALWRVCLTFSPLPGRPFLAGLALPRAVAPGGWCWCPVYSGN